MISLSSFLTFPVEEPDPLTPPSTTSDNLTPKDQVKANGPFTLGGGRSDPAPLLTGKG